MIIIGMMQFLYKHVINLMKSNLIATAYILFTITSLVQAQSPSTDSVDPTPVNPTADSQQPNVNAGQKPDSKGENYNEPNAARSAKYRAEQQRLKQMRRKQKEFEEKRKREMGNPEEVKYQMDQENVGETERRRISQQEDLRKGLIQFNNKYQVEVSPETTTGFLFETLNPLEEFAFKMPGQVPFSIRMQIYTQETNVYGFIKDISKANPLRVYVYEENARIVANSQFFFQSFLSFQAKKGLTYTIRFYNQGMKKLVDVTHTRIFSPSNLDSLYDGSKGLEHMTKGKILLNKISETLRDLRRNNVLDHMNAKTLKNSMKKFSYFQYAQMLGVLVLAITQVQLIKKMFRNDSIL